MTELTKPVHRRTRGSYRITHPRKSRAIVATLAPGDLLEFREAGTRTRWTLPIDEAFRIAVRCAANFQLCFVPIRKKKSS